VKTVRKSLAREEPTTAEDAKVKPKQTAKAAKTKAEPERTKKSPAADDSDSFASDSESMSGESATSGFQPEGRDSAYAHFWAKPSRMQDPELWLETLMEDGELDQRGYQQFSAALERFGGYKEDPQSSSDRLRNLIVFSLQSWIRFAPQEPSQGYLEVATHHLDQLMIQKAFDQGNAKAATKFAKRLEATDHSDRYRQLWDKMEKEAEKGDKSKRRKNPKSDDRKPKDDKTDRKRK
jgi:hypothetical protein